MTDTERDADGRVMVGLRIKQGALDRVEQLAEQQGCTKSEVLRDLLRRGLDALDAERAATSSVNGRRAVDTSRKVIDEDTARRLRKPGKGGG